MGIVVSGDMTRFQEIPDSFWLSLTSDIIKIVRKQGRVMPREAVESIIELSNEGFLTLRSADVCYSLKYGPFLFEMSFEGLCALRDRFVAERQPQLHRTVLRNVQKAIREIVTHSQGIDFEEVLKFVRMDQHPQNLEKEFENYWYIKTDIMTLWNAFHIPNPISDLEDQVRAFAAAIEVHGA